MVEETNAPNKPKLKAARPKPVVLWTSIDVQKWLRRHCSDLYLKHSDKFIQHDITGRTLLRLKENSLLQLGITDPMHRDDIWREIMKLRLKSDILYIRDLERRVNINFD